MPPSSSARRSSTSTPTATAAASSRPRAATSCSILSTRPPNDVADPKTGVSSAQRGRAGILAGAYMATTREEPRSSKRQGAAATCRSAPLGSGSDYTAFLQHLGIASLNVGYGGEDESAGIYHSVYDSFYHVTPFRRSRACNMAPPCRRSSAVSSCAPPTRRAFRPATATSPRRFRAISTRSRSLQPTSATRTGPLRTSAARETSRLQPPRRIRSSRPPTAGSRRSSTCFRSKMRSTI